MANETLPFAIRFIGFSPQETDMLEATLAVEQTRQYRYFRLPEGSLQDPDLYLANADELKALVLLSDLKPSDARPAMLIGTPDIALPYACIERPIRWLQFFGGLDQLIERRAKVLARLNPAAAVLVPERRRTDRLDLDLTDPAEYERMRQAPPAQGGIVVVDRTSTFRDYLADALVSRNVEVSWTDNAKQALALCNSQVVSVVMINTATPDIDPYALCGEIKNRPFASKTVVMMLTDKNFPYDGSLAKAVDCDGFLSKPLLPQQIFPILAKFLQLSPWSERSQRAG